MNLSETQSISVQLVWQHMHAAVMETQSRQNVASGGSSTCAISLTKRHRITWDNVHDTCLANKEIRNMLLYMFRDVYVHDDSQGNCTPCIIDVMSQVRRKTNLKIVNIELYQQVRLEEYNFLFGVHSEHQDEFLQCTPSKNQDEHECKTTCNAAKVLTLYTDMSSMNMAKNACKQSPSHMLKAYSHIVDAMAAAPNPRMCNTFAMVALEINLRDVCECRTAHSAQYARNSKEFRIVHLDSMMPRLSVEIQVRGQVNTMAMYMYGPFPTTVFRG